jgi:mRNA-degrading endonuclease RelE of RelBE toxin-antitoxin system
MKPYEILFQPSVEKDLRKLSSTNRERVIERIEALATNPLLIRLLN